MTSNYLEATLLTCKKTIQNVPPRGILRAFGYLGVNDHCKRACQPHATDFNPEQTQMIKKYLVLICVVASVVLLVIATSLYPGGSILDSNSTGFDWSENFISNLFAAKAINGLDNPSRMWALLGMAFHSVGSGIFFINTSKKIPHRHSAYVLRSVGVSNMLFTFLIATPLQPTG